MRVTKAAVRSAVTVAAVCLLLIVMHALWVRYQDEPLTRDGKVQADIVPVAPDVGGWLSEILVADNQQVHRGDVLLKLDPIRYQIAVDQAKANLGLQRATLAQARREDQRNSAIREELAPESVEQGHTRVEQLRMTVAQAEAALRLAELNLKRTELRAPVDGVVANVSLQPGLFLEAGKPALALVYSASLRIEGYFEETKLPNIAVGDPATVYLMGTPGRILGHVESIAAGIQDRERAPGSAQLANINPTFTWVRLAQRIPVRIAIDKVSPGTRLVPGQTATVEIQSLRELTPSYWSLRW